MELKLYPMLGTDSKRALVRRFKKFGHPYHYSPRGDLLERLSRQTGMTMEQVYNQLHRERLFLLKDSKID